MMDVPLSSVLISEGEVMPNRWERYVTARYQLGPLVSEGQVVCHLKMRHSERSAMTEAERLTRKGFRAKPYRCEECGEWHVEQVRR